MSEKKKNIKLWWIIGAAAVLAVVLFFVIGAKKKKNSDLQVITERCKTDSIEVAVTATGELQPVYKVDVGTQVSGIVQRLYVDFNSVVKKGQLLAELDKSNLNEQLSQAQTSVSNAQSNLTLAQQTYDRTKALYDNKAATLEAYEAATNQLTLAKNQLRTAKSDLSRAQTNLSYATIYSPIDGVVLDKAVEEGQTVASSFNTPTLFTIANDLTQMQVEAKVDEADIGEVKAGQPVSFTVDAFPDDVFSGSVKEVRLNPEVTSNVVTYTVIINAPNPEQKLYPGMTANVTITTKKEVGLTIPVQAFYVNLSDEYQKQLEKKGFTFNSMFKSREDRTEGLKDITKKAVWIKSGDKSFVQKQVTIGTDDRVKAIVSGMDEGQEVLTMISEVSGDQVKQSGDNPFMPEREKKQR
ncbi:MAG: efflux RND transporter periplasmic adaptor subunit [Bacteroidales bacterium]|nr:efflux RND transporter periplasmic adaptor subunit [Bacteroidales bacterium]MDY6347383.1 efflux RND transporter periplasmic adaptor subunit [Bacteroidales bacterium]